MVNSRTSTPWATVDYRISLAMGNYLLVYLLLELLYHGQLLILELNCHRKVVNFNSFFQQGIENFHITLVVFNIFKFQWRWLISNKNKILESVLSGWTTCCGTYNIYCILLYRQHYLMYGTTIESRNMLPKNKGIVF